MANESGSTSQSVTIGLAFCAGAGLTLMVLVAGVGVIQGEAASTPTMALFFALGLVMLIGGIAAWMAVVRPFTHFDDINQPALDEHHEHDSHDEHALAHPAEPAH